MPDTDHPLLEVTDLRVEFRSGREIVRAVNGATFSVLHRFSQSFTFPASFNDKNVLIRFAVGTDDGGALPGWDIDDIAISGIDNTPFPGYVTDAQGCIDASATSGTPQSGIVNSLYGTPLQLLVLSIGAQPLPGAPVTFTALVRSGCSLQAGSPTMAARWATAQHPLSASAVATESRRSAFTNSKCG